MNGAPQPTHNEVIGLACAALAPGVIIDHSVRRTITDFDSIAAAVLAMNTHPLHSDYAFAATTQFGKPLVASPFLLSCLIGSVMTDLRALQVLSMEVRDLKFMKPVHPGDTIQARSCVTTIVTAQCALEITGTKDDGTRFAQFSLILQLAPEEPKASS